MEVYNALYDDSVENVYAISLVGRPAMKGNLVRLSEEEVKLSTISEERREVMGMVLEPNKVIQRSKSNGDVYGIVFSDDTVRKLSRGFFTQKNNDKSTIEHKGQFIEGVTFVESWIKDKEVDKSNGYGYSYPLGTWLATMKIDNDEIWNNYVETGKVTGFSIDSVLKFEKLNSLDMSEQATEVDKKEQDSVLLSEIKKGFNSILEAVKLKKEEVEEPEKEELSEDDKPKDETSKIELSEDVKTTLSEMIKTEVEPLKTELSEKQTKIETLETELAEEKAKVVELSKRPATEKIVQKPVKKEYKDMTKVEQMMYNRGNL